MLAEAMEEVLYRGRNECNHKHHHEELFITDYESEIVIGEYDNIYRLNELAEYLDAISDDDLVKLKLLSSAELNPNLEIDF